MVCDNVIQVLVRKSIEDTKRQINGLLADLAFKTNVNFEAARLNDEKQLETTYPVFEVREGHLR